MGNIGKTLFFAAALFFPLSLLAEDEFMNVRLIRILNGGFARFDSGTWLIGKNPDRKKLEGKNLKILVVGKIGVLFDENGKEIGGQAGCFSLEQAQSIKKMDDDREAHRKLMEREAFTGEKGV